MADRELSKDVVLFWLKRHLSGLEEQTPDQEAMAKQGLSYGQRSAAVKAAAEAVTARETEREAFKRAIEIVERS